jgi:hypothetical protein
MESSSEPEAKRFSRFSNLLSLISAILTICQVAWAGRQMVITGLGASVPAWLLFLTAASTFALGWMSHLWKAGSGAAAHNRARDLQRIGSVKFDYLPDSPVNHQWILSDCEPGEAPVIRAAVDKPFEEGSLQIQPNGKYALDYRFSPAETLTDYIVFSAKQADSGIYLLVRVRSRDESKSQNAWLRIAVGRKSPSRFNEQEWWTHKAGEPLKNGWLLFRLEINDEVCSTFGTEGWLFQQVLGIRLRGAVSISQIELFRHVRQSTALSATAGTR